MIEFRNVSLRYPGMNTNALEALNLVIPDASFFVLLGGSGSGKTTLLKTVNRLVDAFQGRVVLDGQDNRDIPDALLRRRCSFVFQGHALLPHLTVARNVGLPLAVRGVAPTVIAEKVEAVLRQMDLDPAQFSGRFPDELSGGQAQRVGVARALIGDPEVLLMDEPFSALDGGTRHQLQSQLKALKRRTRTTFVFVTHDLFEAIEMADHFAVLHEGRLHQVGTPAEVLRSPATAYVEELFRRPRELMGGRVA